MFRLIIVAAFAIACASAAALGGDYHAEVLKQSSDIHPDGSYVYDLQTSNGIATQESGIGGNHAQGGFSYYSPEGQLIQISYLADENGFQPQGSHLPTPPPIPDYILKSLEYIRTHPQYEEPSSHHQVSHHQVSHHHAPQRKVFSAPSKFRSAVGK